MLDQLLGGGTLDNLDVNRAPRQSRRVFLFGRKTPGMSSSVLLLLVRAVAVQAVSCSERSDHYFWYFSPLIFFSFLSYHRC